MPIEAADAGITDATGAASPLAPGAPSGNPAKANPLRGNFSRLFSLASGLVGNSGGRPRSIRSRLIRIVFILIAPAVLGLAALAVGVYQHEREQLSQATLSTARALTAALDRELAGIMTAAQVLAQSPFLAADDFASFYREAKRLVPLVHGYAIVLVDAAGQQIVNTMLPFGEPLPVRGDWQNHIKVFETGQSSFSDLFTGAISKMLAVNVDVPVYRDNRVKYALGIAVHPARLTDLFQNQSLPPDWVATITDSSGVIVARSRRPDLIGQRTPVRLSAMTQSRSGVVEIKSFEGLPVFAGFSKSEVSSWTVTIGVPITQLYRKPNAVLLYGAIGVLGVLIFGLITALYESTRITRAVQNLIPSALALGRGELPDISPSSVRETDEVAHAFERVHELLQQRTLERDSAKLTIAARSLADEMFRLAVEACPNGMVMIDATGIIVMVNTEIEHQFGYAREDLVGQPVDILVPERLRMQHARHRHEFTPKPETRRMGAGRDLFGRRKDGTEFPVEVGLNPIRSGDDLMVLSVIVDISQRKRTERLKNEFVATVSHELRTPLTSISGSLGLLEGRWAKDMPESAARLLTIAHTNSKRLARLINDILDIEKIESGHVVFNRSRVAVRSLVEQAIEDNRGYADNYGIRCDSMPHRPMPTRMSIPTGLPRSLPTSFLMRSSSRRPTERWWSPWRPMRTTSGLPCAIKAPVSPTTSNRTSSRNSRKRTRQTRGKKAEPDSV